MTECFSSETALADWISGRLGTSPVMIDGWLGSGKTTLAESLAKRFSGTAIDVDFYLARQQDQFVEALDVSRLINDIQQAIRPFVSGICMREVHAIMRKPPALHLYVKRMANWGWADEDEALANSGPANNLDAFAPPGAVILECRSYHEKWNPHQSAHAIYERLKQ